MKLDRDPGTCLVTGAGGFVGRRMVRLLRAQGAAVVGWTRDRVNLLDSASVAEAMQATAPTTVFHLAAAGVASSRAHDADLIGADVAMTANIVNACPAQTRLIYGGSMAEYGRSGRLSENDLCRPRTAYAIAKHAAGLYALSYGQERGLDVSVARIFGVYGPGEPAVRFFPSLISGLKAGRRIALSDGRQLRDFMQVDDVCAALAGLGASAQPLPPVVNVGTGVSVSIRDVALWIARSLGADQTLLDFGARPRSPGDEDRLEADTAQLVQLIGAAPPQRLAPGLDVCALMETTDGE